jgi:hypothetical protein
MGAGSGTGRRRAEAAFFGLGSAALACWISVALVASFAGELLPFPYWPDIPHLRTDTTGVIAFGVSAICLTASRYLRLASPRAAAQAPPAGGWPRQTALARAVAETAALMGIAAFAYLSMNNFTHYGSLRLQLTHLWPWPSEGTVRVIALAVIAVSLAVARYLRTAPAPAAEPAEAGGLTAHHANGSRPAGHADGAGTPAGTTF